MEVYYSVINQSLQGAIGGNQHQALQNIMGMRKVSKSQVASRASHYHGGHP
jgi:hypothetical protein